jgi:SEC-C motif-containing protein
VAAKVTRDCPCGSGTNYKSCCGPLHAGLPAKTAEALMRSRYSAFALGLGDYLLDTLAVDHVDRAAPRDVMVRELARIHERRRFMKLTVLDATEDEVLFHARVFEKGQDRSFAELSTFVRESGAWRYASGVSLSGSQLPADVSTLDREGFLAIADAGA